MIITFRVKELLETGKVLSNTKGHQPTAMNEQATGFADVGGGNPYLGDETGGAELGELDGIVLVGLDA